MALDAKQWLQDWAERNLAAPGYVETKSSMREQAKACAADALAAGLSIAQLKEAAGGDLEIYLGDRQNAETDSAAKR
jgi:hypothetical protein